MTFAFIPGVGRIGAGQVLEGDQYARFAPSLLVEIPESSGPVLVEPKPPPPSAPKPIPAVIIPPHPPPAPEEAPKAPTTMAEAGFVSPEELVATVDAENKQTQAQIDRAVERLNPVDEIPAEVTPPKEEPEAEPVKEEPKKVPKPDVKPTKPGSGKKPSGRR